MKKKLFTILLCGIMVLGITGCGTGKQRDKQQKENENYTKELVQCLENELVGYLTTEEDHLMEIPLSEIKAVDHNKIEYYKGSYASEHPDNRYVIVYPKNGTYDFDVMKDFDQYFYSKFPVYQSDFVSSITIYVHSQNNDIDFNNIINKCQISNDMDSGKSIPSKTMNKLKDTKKIVIKSSKNVLGTISNQDKLTEILNTISSSKQYGDFFLCDGNGFDFELYDKNNQLIDTIYVWGDGNRLIPSSIHSGCSYYSISNDLDLRRIIEEETNYVFYSILNFGDYDKQKQQFIYNDSKYGYYLNSENTNEILIQFTLNHQIMTLKYALENQYISAEKVVHDYPDILVKR